MMSNNYSQNTFSNNHSSFNTNSNNITHIHTAISDEKSRILSWISPLESRKRHRDVIRTRTTGVGEWVLRRNEFQAWRQGANDRSVGRILFGSGDTGAGKTFICSLVIDTLCDMTAGGNAVVACLYCDYRSQREQTVEAMIGSLLRQFVTALPEIPEAVKQAFRAAETGLGGRAPELAKIIELFPAVSERFQEVFICVDGLDESAADHRAGFLRALHQILEESPNVKLFLTARPHVQPVLERNILLDMSIITIQPLFSDIERFVETKLDADQYPQAMNNGLRSEIWRKVKELSKIFLLVALQVDSVLGEVTIGGRRRKLREMTNDLSGSYTATLGRIRGQHRTLARFGISALMWISLAERPLHINELCQALAVEVGSPDINADMVPEIETVVTSCMGLVTIDRASSTVRLVHATLKEYLLSPKSNAFQNPHATIADICLSYLGAKSVRDLPSDLINAPPLFPLLVYASCHWGAHARKGLTVSVRHRALWILNQYPQHVAASIFLSNGGAPWYWGQSSAGFTGLHYVAYLGITGLLQALLSMGQANLNQTDEWGRTPLIVAAEKGNNGVVGILTSCGGVNPNSVDRHGQSSLSQASSNGHEKVITLLLNHIDINPNSADRPGYTALALASAKGHEGVVRILLRHTSVKPDCPDRNGRTPLFQASSSGHEGVVRILLSHHYVNPNSADSAGRTPLHQASANGHGGVVRALLERVDVNPDSRDREGRTPLLYASENGHTGVASILLTRSNVNPSSADRDGRTPLLQASQNGHEGVVGLLLNYPYVNPNSTSWAGQSPLLQASQNGHEGVVRILLNRADVDPNSADRDGRTPLQQASGNGHEGVVRILLGCADANPDSADRDGRTPLLQASQNGHEAAVRILLNRADVNPNSADWAGRTPLLEASSNGHAGVVRILLNRTDLNPNSADRDGRTPLLQTSLYGHEDVVRILLNYVDTNPNSADRHGYTALILASANGHEGVVATLLGRTDINPNTGPAGQTPLHLASANGREGVVRILLSRTHVNPNPGDWAGRTPLLQASENGHEGVARMLRRRLGISPNPADWYGQASPLYLPFTNPT